MKRLRFIDMLSEIFGTAFVTFGRNKIDCAVRSFRVRKLLDLLNDTGPDEVQDFFRKRRFVFFRKRHEQI